MGGINQIAPLGSLPVGDSPYAFNVIAAEYGLRVRLGWKEWCTSVLDASGASGQVRAMVPFQGSFKNGSTDKVFATTTKGIYDVTASSASPTLVVTFSNTSGEAGYGVSVVMATPAGRYLVYCDEVNGLYVYSEQTTAWTPVPLGVTAPWTANTAVAVGNKVVNGVNAYACTVGGITAASGGPTGYAGSAIVDNTAQWGFYQGPWVGATAYAVGARVVNGTSPKRIYVCTVAGTSAATGGPTTTASGIVDGVGTLRWNYVTDYYAPIGPSLADQQLGYTGDPANFVAATVWKSRLWLVERDSTRAWYLNVNSLFGTATSFDFGQKMRTGGPLVNLYNWSYDAGGGLDTQLVAIGSSGDVVIYQGTDPSSASTFGIKGSWSVGGVPYGRRIATEYGGDMLVMSTLGLVPLSRLVVGQPVVVGERSVYATDKIGPLFALAVSQGRLVPGWAMALHPEDNSLLLLAPTTAGGQPDIYAMSFASRGWFQYRELPMYSCAAFDGQMYFGTTDGRVCINTGYNDGQQLGSAYTAPIRYAFSTGFTNLGTTKQKRIAMVRPYIQSQTPNPAIAAVARFDFDLSEPAQPSASNLTKTGSLWDTAKWDANVWPGAYVALKQLSGATGTGRHVALAVVGSAISRTVFVSCDVWFEVGGDL